MLKQGQTKLAIEIMAESLSKIKLTVKFYIMKVQCYLNLEQILLILSQNEFVWEKLEVSLVFPVKAEILAQNKKPVPNFYSLS